MRSLAKITRCPDGWCLICEERQLEEQAHSFFDRLRVCGLSENTCLAYGYDLVHFFRWLLSENMILSGFSYQDLFRYIKYQVDAKAKPRSINRRLVSCNIFLKFLNEKGFPVDPSHFQFQPYPKSGGLRRRRYKRGFSQARVKVPSELVQPLEVQQINALLASTRRYRDVCIILLMALVGLRRREVLSLLTSDIDLGSNTVLIRGKGRKERSMPIPKMLRTAIFHYLSLERPQELSHKKMFCVLQGSHIGAPMSKEGLRSLFRKRAQSLNISHATAHRLRHSFAYSMVKAGVSVIVLQRMMGHAQYQTTLRYVSLKAEDIAEQYLKAMTTIESRYAERD